MKLKIHRILKSDLSESDSINIKISGMSNTSGMTISHYAFAPKQTEVSIPFSFDSVNEHVPKSISVEFGIAVRKQIDLDGIGPNGKRIEDIGNDIGEYNYKDKSPSVPKDLPPGFREVYKG